MSRSNEEYLQKHLIAETTAANHSQIRFAHPSLANNSSEVRVDEKHP